MHEQGNGAGDHKQAYVTPGKKWSPARVASRVSKREVHDGQPPLADYPYPHRTSTKERRAPCRLLRRERCIRQRLARRATVEVSESRRDWQNAQVAQGLLAQPWLLRATWPKQVCNHDDRREGRASGQHCQPGTV